MDYLPKLCVSFKKEFSEPIINIDVGNDLYKTKLKIDKYKNDWNYYRSVINEYELIGNSKMLQIPKIRPICRSYFKIWEINEIYNIIPKCKEPIVTTTLCEAPGSFCQAIIHYRKSILTVDDLKKDIINGISLKEGTNYHTKWKNFPEKELIKFNNYFGDPDNINHNGDITNPEIIKSFIKQIGRNSILVTADGGLEISTKDENYKEQIHFSLFFNEILIALSIQKSGGDFILKIYDILTLPTLQLIYLLTLLYEKVEIIKPQTTRQTNSEKYVICKNFKNISTKYLNELHNISKKMWNMTGSYIRSIFENNYIDKNFKKYIENINMSQIPHQINKIEEALSLLENSITDVDLNYYHKKLKIYNELQVRCALTWAKIYNMPYFITELQ